ncbi:MAG: hypothetical protein WD648_12920 [Planctomycetaceae bacterium]
MVIIGLLSFLVVTLYGIAVVAATIGKRVEAPLAASRGRGRKSICKVPERRASDFWFGFATRLVWGSILVCISLLGVLEMLNAVAS